MADIPEPDDEESGEELSEGGSSFARPNVPVFSGESYDASSLPAPTERHFYGTLKDKAPVAENGAAPVNPPQNAAQPETAQDIIAQTGTPDAPPNGAAPPDQKKHHWFRPSRSHAPMNEKLLTMPAPRVPLNTWQEILYAHANLKNGVPVDETGKPINLGMDSKFGQPLAQLCLDLDAAGYKGQFKIISGCRTSGEQAGLIEHYKNIGSKHPVAAVGCSPHEWGVATDVTYTGKNPKKFYNAFHDLGEKNGLEFVKDDINHVQIKNAHQVVAESRQKKSVEMAAASRGPGLHASTPAA